MKKLLFMVCANHVLLCFVSALVFGGGLVVWSRCGFTSNYVCNSEMRVDLLI